MHEYDGQLVYGDAEHYERQNGALDLDLDFYVRGAKESGGPALECACGTGRVTLPMARAGVAVAGIEYSFPMLERAKAKAMAEGLSIEWAQGDMRTVSLGRRFRFVCIPYNAFLHLLDRESVEAFLARVRDHLLPGGRFAFDIFVPDFRFLTRDPGRRHPGTHAYPDPAGGGTVEISESNRYDRVTQINHVTWFLKRADGTEEAQPLTLRMFFPQEMDALLHYNGFRIVQKYGGFRGEPFDRDSPRQVFVCEAAGRPPGPEGMS